MATQAQYSHRLGGDGVAEGLPFKRPSHLYDVHPEERYPTALSYGTDPDFMTMDRGVFVRPPHLPTTFQIPPHVNGRNGETYLDTTYFVLKRGQAIMVSDNRDTTVSYFTGEGSTVEQTYNDPEGWVRPELLGYTDGGTTTSEERYVLSSDSDADAEKRIFSAQYEALGATDADAEEGEASQADYEADSVLTVEEFDAMDEADKEGFDRVYAGTGEADEDIGVEAGTNDEIATGGVDQYAQVEKAVFGSTDRVERISVDTDAFYFGIATQIQGFMYPSTGGAPRTLFYNSDDVAAEVVLPAEDNANPAPQALGGTTDLSGDNADAWKGSASMVEAYPTVGVAHTDMENAVSHRHFHYSRGTEPRSPLRAGRLQIPFVDIDKLEEIGGSQMGENFSFSDRRDGRSGLKVGLFDVDDLNVHQQNVYSLLHEQDGGYANLYYNFGAPFVTSKGRLRRDDEIVPDLFGNYTTLGAGLFEDGTGENAAPFGSVNTSGVNGHNREIARDQERHLMGKVHNIYDVPTKALERLHVNRIFQNKFVSAARERNFLNEGYRRLGQSSDTDGMEQILADFIFLLLGGSSNEWASQPVPSFRGRPQDLSTIGSTLVYEGVFGLAEIRFDRR